MCSQSASLLRAHFALPLLRQHLLRLQEKTQLCSWHMLPGLSGTGLGHAVVTMPKSMLAPMQALKIHHKDLHTPPSATASIIGFYHKQNDLIDTLVEVASFSCILLKTISCCEGEAHLRLHWSRPMCPLASALLLQLESYV